MEMILKPTSDRFNRALCGSVMAMIGGLICFAAIAAAQSKIPLAADLTDPRGPAELTLCSQNLEIFSTQKIARERGVAKSAYQKKLTHLLNRFVKADCDIIAVQEVFGAGDVGGGEALQSLASALQGRTGRPYQIRLGVSLDKMLQTGYIVATDRAEILNATSYTNIELPRLIEKERPQKFVRPPLELQVSVKGRGESAPKILTLINIHFKSKRGAIGDPTGLEYETYRMQMAEALRRIIELRHRNSFQRGESLLAVLGDRNANFDVATAKILEGVLTLADFRANGVCRLSKRGVPLCQPNAAQPQQLFSVLTGDPQVKNLPGTYVFKNVSSWLDDILLPAESLAFVNAKFGQEGDYDSGVVTEFGNASDHAMVYTRFNW